MEYRSTVSKPYESDLKLKSLGAKFQKMKKTFFKLMFWFSE